MKKANEANEANEANVTDLLREWNAGDPDALDKANSPGLRRAPQNRSELLPPRAARPHPASHRPRA